MKKLALFVILVFLALTSLGTAAGKASLGIYIEETSSSEMPVGFYVSRVLPNSPAQKAGLKPNDIILSINGTEATSLSVMESVARNAQIGDKTDFVVARMSLTTDSEYKATGVASWEQLKLTAVWGTYEYETTLTAKVRLSNSSSLYLRKKNGEAFSTIPNGATVQLIEYTYDTEFAHVSYNGTKGYVNPTYLSPIHETSIQKIIDKLNTLAGEKCHTILEHTDPINTAWVTQYGNKWSIGIFCQDAYHNWSNISANKVAKMLNFIFRSNEQLGIDVCLDEDWLSYTGFANAEADSTGNIHIDYVNIAALGGDTNISASNNNTSNNRRGRESSKTTSQTTTKATPAPTKTSAPCSTCGGDGQITSSCSSCGGDGKTDSNCLTCSGSGARRCKTCSEKGYKTCTGCRGDGLINCWYCNGSGKAGSSTCRQCKGTGKEKHDSCSGLGYKICSSCDGAGYHVCSSCSGLGKSYYSCSNCNGKGNVTQKCTKCQ